MLKISFLSSALVLLCNIAFADVAHIDLDKITSDPACKAHFRYIKENKQYYKTWTNDWKYDKSRVELIGALKDAYTAFSKLKKQDHELQLLLGDIAHYLYNMDDKPHFDLALKHYKAAIKSDANDIRGRWFLGIHLGLAALPLKAIEQFSQAQSLAGGNYEGYF